MEKFSIKETAFAGYRLLAARPAAVAAWFIFSLAVLVGMNALTVTMAGPQLTAIKEMQASGSPDPATMMSLTAQTMPVMALAIIVPLMTSAILTAAILRTRLRPQQSSLGGLRLGADELRLFVVGLVLTLVFAVPVVLGYIGGIVGLFAVAGPQTAAAALQGRGAMPVPAMVAAGVGAVPGMALFIWLYLKLSLAFPQTLAERSIRIFNSWGLTRGVFWRTLATYVLAGIPAAVGYVALMAILAQVKGEGFFQAMRPDVSSMAAAFSGPQLGAFVAQALLQVIYTTALLIPAAAIYVAVAEEPAMIRADDEDDEDYEDEE